MSDLDIFIIWCLGMLSYPSMLYLNKLLSEKTFKSESYKTVNLKTISEFDLKYETKESIRTPEMNGRVLIKTIGGVIEKLSESKNVNIPKLKIKEGSYKIRIKMTVLFEKENIDA